jgi:hypothetical protein
VLLKIGLATAYRNVFILTAILARAIASSR